MNMNDPVIVKRVPSTVSQRKAYIPAFCAKTREKALEGYKHQLKLTLMIMLEDGERIPEVGEEPEEIY